MVTTRFQAKRRRLDMDSAAIGESEGLSSNVIGRPGEDATGDKRKKVIETSGGGIRDKIPKLSSPLHCCKRLISKRAKKISFNAFKPREKNGAISSAHDCINPESHDTFLHVAPIGGKGEEPRPTASSTGHDYFRFRCPLGDIWHDAFADVCRHRTVKTGDPWIDRALRSIPFQGFDITHYVGSGKFSYVLAGNCNQKFLGMVAVKILKRDHFSKDSPAIKTVAPWHVEFPEEVLIHRSLNHPNIVKWLDYMTYMQRQCIIMDFCHLGGLEELLEATPGGILTEQVAKRYFTQMVAGVEYLHAADVVHRDIVCSNWAIDRHNVIKLIDFGCALRWSNTQPLLKDKPPTAAAYLPPEPLFGEPYDPKCIDIWALGVTLFKMVTSSLPFGEEPVFHPGMMTSLPYPKDTILPLGIDLKKMLDMILHANKVVRYTINRIKQAYWFKEETTKFYVSNHFLGRQPLKIKEGPLERRWKKASGLLKPEILHKAWVIPKLKMKLVKIVKVQKIAANNYIKPNSAIGLGEDLRREAGATSPEDSASVPQCATSSASDTESSAANALENEQGTSSENNLESLD